MKYTSPDILDIFAEAAQTEAENKRRASLTTEERAKEDAAEEFARILIWPRRSFVIKHLARLVPDYLVRSRRSYGGTFDLWREDPEILRLKAEETRRLLEEWTAQQPDAAELAHYFAEVETARLAVPEEKW